ncbi:probable LRR receptor-like serine/threonine-protein kinase At1g51860 [Typha latifolia]|uniref:probable LRR receptor-like serine/threonine-protein kinase At1g51860 n=1 Tax=Typha latifolia TaxID=4733 RepID=UPI003C2FF82D
MVSWCSFLLLLVFNIAAVQVHGHTPRTEGFISIDCGATRNSTDLITGILYTTDDQFIETGINSKVNPSKYTNLLPQQYSTVRSFPDGDRNCYTLNQATHDTKYLIRASFMYGNYDGKNSVQKNSPLLFDLHIGIDRWTTVNISHPTNPFTYEAITRISANQRLSVCLIRTNSSSTPFISSLEMRPLKSTLYPIVSSFFDSIVLLMRRNLGASGDKIIRYPDDPYDRFWEPMNITLDVLATDKTVQHNKTKGEYEVPSVVLQTASVSAGVNDSVGFYWGSPDSNTDYYVILHFSELELLPEKDVRVFDVYSDGDHQLGTKHAPTFLENSAYATWPAWYAFSLNASEGATRPPLLNAFEIYSIGETSYETTNVGDVEAMLAIKEAYKLKKNWVGDPCLPEKYAWDGVTCGIRANDFRVTALNLSATGLVGQVSNFFSRLTELQSLDLSYNNLTGKVPDSVATISNLQVLNLSGNCIEVPDALIEKTKDSSLTLSAIVDARLQGMLNTESVWKVTELAMRCSCTLIRDQKMSEVVIHLRESLEREIAERSTSTTAESQDRSFQREDYADRSFQREDYADSQLQFRTRKFTYKELEIITKNFERVIGRGGFGTVYHGLLEDGTEVAVKIKRRTESLVRFDSFEKYYLNEERKQRREVGEDAAGDCYCRWPSLEVGDQQSSPESGWLTGKREEREKNGSSSPAEEGKKSLTTRDEVCLKAIQLPLMEMGVGIHKYNYPLEKMKRRSYYGKFVFTYGLITKPLTNMLKKDSYTWSSESKEAFQLLKQVMTSTPILALPNFNKPFEIEVDASGTDVGAVLSQDDHPIAYFNKALGTKFQSYSSYERELLAIVMVVTKMEIIFRWKNHI